MTDANRTTLLASEIAKTGPDSGPAGYYPLSHGFYEIKPGLYPFGADFGNGVSDKKVFQIDHCYAHYRQAKLAGRAQKLEKYYQTQGLSDVMQKELISFLCWRLGKDHPKWFEFSKLENHSGKFDCRLSGETLIFDSDFNLIETRSSGALNPAYVSGLDAIASQIQEDLAFISLKPDGDNWLSAIHLCFPNYWAAQDKIGRGFAAIHNPVAGIEPLNKNANSIAKAMVHKGPFVRFSWGLSTDDRLNHHPVPPPGVDEQTWCDRKFDPTEPALFLRVERQTIFGLPAVDSALFTIRTYLTDCSRIKQDPVKNAALQSAIRSMSNESLEYKGLFESKQEILEWLKTE